MKKLTDKEILETVINAVGLTPYKFALKLQYKSSMAIYHVLSDISTRPISENLISRITLYFPNVSTNFLKTGEGSPLRAKNPSIIKESENNTETPKTFMSDVWSVFERLQGIYNQNEEILAILRKKSD